MEGATPVPRRASTVAAMRQTVLRKGPDVRRRILLVVVFLTPLFFLRTAYNAFNVPKLSLLMVGVAAVAVIRGVELLQGAERSSLQLIAVPAAAVAAPLAIATLLSPYRVWALVGDHTRFTGLVPYLVVILLGIQIADAFRGEVRPLAWAFLASGAVAGAYAVVQVSGMDPIEWSGSEQATVTIGNTNFSGAFFAICVPIAAGLLLAESDRRLHVVPLAVLVFAGWVLARSELAWAAGMAGLFVFGGVVLSDRWRWSRAAAFVAAGVIALAGVGIVVITMFAKQPDFIPATIERRAEWWGASFRMTAASPLFGHGPNSFSLEHSQYRQADDVSAVSYDITTDPHSVPLAFLTATGILGLAGFLVLAGWVVRKIISTQADRILGAAFGAAAIAYLVQSLLSIDVVTLRFAAWTVIGGMAAALAPPLVPPAKRPSRKKKRKIEPTSEPLRALPGVVAVLLVGSLALAWAMGFLSADIGFRRGLALAASGGSGAQEVLRSAIDFRESNIIYRTDYGNLVGGNAVSQGLSEGGDRGVAESLMEEAEEAFGFIDRLPRSNSVVAYARLMRDWAEVEPSVEDRALELYDYAAELDPNNFLILEEAAGVAETFGRTDVAEDLASEAARLRASVE